MYNMYAYKQENEKKDQKQNLLELTAEKINSKSDKYNSNKSANLKKNSKHEKKDIYTQSLMQTDFLSNKRKALNMDNNNNLSIYCNEKLIIDDQIEFSSKNVVSSSKLFDKELAKSNGVSVDNGKKKNRIDHFFSSVGNNNTTNNSTNTNIVSINNDSKIPNYFVYFYFKYRLLQIKVQMRRFKSNL